MKPLIAANWKMNKPLSEAEVWVEEFKERLSRVYDHNRMEVAICAPFTHLAALSTVLTDSPIGLGAQDVSAHAAGAYTGEVSAAMLKDVGVRYVIVGHSERRAYHGEDDALVREKLGRALGEGLTPILCVGERLEEREAGRAEAVTLGQLTAALENLSFPDADALVVAYEPIWAIGTGKTATEGDAQEMCGAVRARLRDLFPELGDGIRILYGGSMKPDNAAGLLAQPDINGGLVGGASLELDALLDILEAVK